MKNELTPSSAGQTMETNQPSSPKQPQSKSSRLFAVVVATLVVAMSATLQIQADYRDRGSVNFVRVGLCTTALALFAALMIVRSRGWRER
jgi:hypothetical protein